MPNFNQWVLLYKGCFSELQKFPFISKFHVCIETQLMKTSKIHSHGKYYCPTIISEMQYADISTRNWGWKGRVPLILRGLVTIGYWTECPLFILLHWYWQYILSYRLKSYHRVWCETNRHQFWYTQHPQYGLQCPYIDNHVLVSLHTEWSPTLTVCKGKGAQSHITHPVEQHILDISQKSQAHFCNFCRQVTLPQLSKITHI